MAVAQVEAGMTRSQVRFLLGTPMVADSFDQDRWDYVYFVKIGKTGDLISKEKFGDAQYHIEWSAPTVIDGDSQWRGNSGAAAA